MIPESLMALLETQLGASLAVGVGVTAAHAIGHMAVGEEWAFEEAGVNTAGLVVFLAATTATYILLGMGGAP